MSLTLHIQELNRFRVSADFSLSDGRISLALRPLKEIDPPPVSGLGLLIHFETEVGDGHSKLNVFTSSEREEKTRRPITKLVTSAGIAEQGHFDFLSEDNHIAGERHAPLPHSTKDLANIAYCGLNANSTCFEVAFPQNQQNHGADHFGYSTQGGQDLSPESGFTSSECDIFSLLSPATSPSFENDSQPSPNLWSAFSAAETDIPKGTLDWTPQSPTHSLDADSHARVRRPRRLSCLNADCTRSFMSEYTRRLHMRTHEPKTRHPCEMGCSETFSRQHDRLRHEVSKHGRRCEWPCNHCRRFFSCQATRDDHKCSRNKHLTG